MLLLPYPNLPEQIVAGTSTTGIGNIGLHVGDESADVKTRRENLAKAIDTKTKNWLWLNQTHGSRVVMVNEPQSKAIEADGVVTKTPGLVPVVMTADCLPVLLMCRATLTLGAIHAGWRGLDKDILKNAMSHFREPAQVLAWIGPGISNAHYQVDSNFQERFVKKNPSFLSAFSVKEGGIYANLSQIALLQLNALGVTEIFDVSCCTYNDERFYSYRKSNEKAGRMASFIVRKE